MSHDKLLTQIGNAIEPWKSPMISEYTESYFSEAQDKINMCLACTKEDCNNCLSGKETSEKNGRPMKSSPEEVEVLVGQGYKNKEICSMLGISLTTLKTYKKLLRKDKGNEGN